MNEVHEILQGAMQTVHDTLAPLFFDHAEISLLKVSETANDFEVIETIDSSWFFEYSEFRQNFKLEIAKGDELTESMNVATHVKVDEDIYVIRQADTLPPKGTDVTWKLFCDRFVERAQFRAIY